MISRNHYLMLVGQRPQEFIEMLHFLSRPSFREISSMKQHITIRHYQLLSHIVGI